jgi:hypothetical protein
MKAGVKKPIGQLHRNAHYSFADGCYHCLIVIAGLMVFTSAWAADVKWENSTGNGLWSDPANWNGGALPGEGDVAVIGSNVTLDTDATVSKVSLSNSPVIEGSSIG